VRRAGRNGYGIERYDGHQATTQKRERTAAAADPGCIADAVIQKGPERHFSQQIARQAELAVGTIYFYFRSKEEIFAALQEEGLELLLGDVQRALDAGANATECLHNIAQAYLNFSQEHKNYFDVINYFLSAGDVMFTPEIKQQIDQHGIRILKVVEQALQDGVDQGRFRAVNVRRHALLFWVILHGLVPFRKMKDTLLADDSHAALYYFAVDNFIGGLSQAVPFRRVSEGRLPVENEETSEGNDRD
jgi:AcrR family transcriptional regulator